MADDCKAEFGETSVDRRVPVVGFDYETVYQNLDGELQGEGENEKFTLALEAIRKVLYWVGEPIEVRLKTAHNVSPAYLRSVGRQSTIRLMAVLLSVYPECFGGIRAETIGRAFGVSANSIYNLFAKIRLELGFVGGQMGSYALRSNTKRAIRRRKKRGKKKATASRNMPK